MKLLSLFENSLLIRYLTFGATAALVQIVALLVFVHSIPAPETVLSCLAFIIAVFVNYSLQRTLTFGNDSPHSVLFPKFAMVAICGFFSNAVIFHVSSQYVHYLLAQFFTIFVVLVFNFLMNKRFVFSYRA